MNLFRFDDNRCRFEPGCDHKFSGDDQTGKSFMSQDVRRSKSGFTDRQLKKTQVPIRLASLVQGRLSTASLHAQGFRSGMTNLNLFKAVVNPRYEAMSSASKSIAGEPAFLSDESLRASPQGGGGSALLGAIHTPDWKEASTTCPVIRSCAITFQLPFGSLNANGTRSTYGVVFTSALRA